jgi:hypothetical protein
MVSGQRCFAQIVTVLTTSSRDFGRTTPIGWIW